MLPRWKLVVVFFDADALIAGAASQSGASCILLQLCELGLLRGITCEQVIAECRGNLKSKLPPAEPLFQEIVDKSLQVSPNPLLEDLEPWEGMAHEKDLPILVSAIEHKAQYLVTFNVRHYSPSNVGLVVCPPGELLQQIRKLLSTLG